MSKKIIMLKGRLKIYMQTSLYLGLLLLLEDAGIYFLDVRAGFLLSCFLLLYFMDASPCTEKHFLHLLNNYKLLNVLNAFTKCQFILRK